MTAALGAAVGDVLWSVTPSRALWSVTPLACDALAVLILSAIRQRAPQMKL